MIADNGSLRPVRRARCTVGNMGSNLFRSYGPSLNFYPCGAAAVSRDQSAMLRSVPRQMLLILMLTTPALAISPAEQRGKTFALTNCARCHSVDRVNSKPAQDRTTIPNPASALPGGNTWRGLGRRNRHRPSDHAGVPARPRPDSRPAVVYEDPRISSPPPLRLRPHRPVDHLIRNSAERGIKCRDGSLWLDLVKPFALFEQSRRNDFSILVDNSCRQSDLGLRP